MTLPKLLFCLPLISNVFFAAFCEDYRCSDNFPVVSDLSQNDCGDNFYEPHYYYDTCFPGCLQKPDVDIDICNPNPCPPGYICPEDPENEGKRCEIDEDSCLKYYANYDSNPYYKAMWKPECLETGEWAPKQCKGEVANGMCFCYGAVGNRLFGQEFSQKAKNMTCACSRKRDELSKQRSRLYVSLHCDSMGNFEPLQCDSGFCWCVESKTGEILASAVPGKAMQMLPCYSKSDVGDVYLRQCESEEYAQVKIKDSLNKHGTLYANFRPIMCDGDGSYGRYKLQNGIAYCTWRDNVGIGSWQVSIEGGISDLNCYCARDSKMYELNGLTLSKDCSSNGNYKPVQTASDGTFYCVDSDGFPKTDFMSTAPDCSKIL